MEEGVDVGREEEKFRGKKTARCDLLESHKEKGLVGGGGGKLREQVKDL